MREIKFRAWDDLNKRMIIDFFWLDSDGGTWYDQDPHGVDMSGRKRISLVTRLSVMQFTGLKDKNGKECYEKDYDADGNMIDWCDRCCGYQFHQIDIPTGDHIFCHNCEGNFMIQDHIHDFEIIGNIYENPQLLQP
jgi:uncharacterized phage protein (TIGR01671 family)